MIHSRACSVARLERRLVAGEMMRSVAVVVRFRGRPWCGTVAGRERVGSRGCVSGRQVPAVGAADGEAALLEKFGGRHRDERC